MSFVQFSTKMAAWLPLTFFICLHHELSSTHFTIKYQEYRCLKNMIHQTDSEKRIVTPFSKFYGKIWVGFCLNTGKPFFLEVSIERAYVLLKNGNRDFQNGLPFERSACIYVTITGNCGHFQYFNFETDVLEKGNLFQKTGGPFFS